MIGRRQASLFGERHRLAHLVTERDDDALTPYDDDGAPLHVGPPGSAGALFNEGRLASASRSATARRSATVGSVQGRRPRRRHARRSSALSGAIAADVSRVSARDVEIRRALVAWFARGHRDMPWRRTRDPYAIWVSRDHAAADARRDGDGATSTRLLARFPTVDALARRRSTTCWRTGRASATTGARATCTPARATSSPTTAARLPATAEELRALPGIGALHARARSRASRSAQAAPIVDGNVVRVLSRALHALDGAAATSAVTKRVWAARRASWCRASAPATSTRR